MRQDYGLMTLGSHNVSRTTHEKHIAPHFAEARRVSSIDDTTRKPNFHTLLTQSVLGIQMSFERHNSITEYSQPYSLKAMIKHVRIIRKNLVES